MDQTSPNEPSPPPTDSTKGTLFHPVFLVIFLLVCVIGALGIGYVWGKTYMPVASRVNLTPSPSLVVTSSPSPSLSSGEGGGAWLTAYENSNLPLQYPAGWHVYRQFILDRENAPMTTYINSKPIYYSDPNQGGIADIVITTSSGYKNPQGAFEQMLQDARTKNKNLKESTMTVSGVTMYKFEGSYVWEGNGTFQILRMYALLPSTDVMQQQIVSFEVIDRGSGDFGKNAEVLNHIIQTLKHK